ncbi:MAG: endonuclease/exonuclease/phosphatase family protein [Thermoanaerobaculia bacterium]
MFFFTAFIAYRVAFVYTVRTGSCEPPPELEDRPLSRAVPPIDVMSWNIEGHAALLDGDHVDEIAHGIVRARPAIAGLQEVHRGTWQARFRDQIGELTGATGMEGFFGRSYHAFRGEYGNAVLSSFPVERVIIHPLPSIGEPRTLLEARIVIEGQEIAFFVTHLVTWGQLNAATRTEQLECVASHLRSAAVPWILVGDLNAPPSAGEIEKFIASARAREAGPAEATHRLTGRQLDYIFTDAGWEMVRPRTLEGASDHLAAVATLHRPAEGSPGGQGE